MTEKLYSKQASKIRRSLPESVAPDARLQRLRSGSGLRSLLAETKLNCSDLVCPIYLAVDEDHNPIPFVDSITLAKLSDEIVAIQACGIGAIYLHAADYRAPLAKACAFIKRIAPDMLIFAELNCSEFYARYKSDNVAVRSLDNDAVLEDMRDAAILLAQSAADVVVPNEMYDGVVTNLRNLLDSTGFSDILIMAHGAKYASAGTSFNEQSYRMNPANSALALRSFETVINEDADIVMLRPANNYLDVLGQVANEFSEVPVAAFQGSDIVAMIKSASSAGFLNERDAIIESLLSIKRAGASFIITYFAKTMAKYLA